MQAMEVEARSAPPSGARSTSFRPLKILVVWYLGTLTLWLLVYRRASDVGQGKVLAVACLGTVALVLGAKWGNSTFARYVLRLPLSPVPVRATWRWSLLVIAGSTYYFARAVLNLRVPAGSGRSIGEALLNPSVAYSARQQSISLAEGLNSPGGFSAGLTLAAVLNLTGVLLFVLPATLALRWQVLPAPVRVVAILSFASFVISWFAIGTGKGVFDASWLLLTGLLLFQHRRLSSSGAPDSGGSLWHKRERRRLHPAVPLFALFGVLFALLGGTYILGQRIVALNAAIEAEGSPPFEFIETTFGREAAVGVYAVTGYFSQGYTGLGASLDQKFVWTAGSGSSEALETLLPFVYDKQQALEAYPYRAEYNVGWPAKSKWQTMYAWLASDLTVPGAILFVGALAAIAAAGWAVALARGGILAGAIFIQATYTLAYVPLNNGPLNATADLLSLWLLLGGALFWWLVASVRLTRGGAEGTASTRPTDLRAV